MWRRRTHLAMILLIFCIIHLIISSNGFRFLKEEVVNTESEEEGHMESEEFGMHYPPGTFGFYMCIVVAMILTCFAGIMSGLTVGLLSIDTLELEMKMIHGTEEQKKLAAKVLPLLNKHHYLLVTLLLCNAFAMEALPIFLDAIVPSVWAIIISVT